MTDPYHLQRFLDAQEHVYTQALDELRDGRKRSHWMWFVFPQLKGLGHSEAALHYGIGSREEADAYRQHPVLGVRLVECTESALAVVGKTARQIFGSPDDLKFRSSMTLFADRAGGESVFRRALAKYYEGMDDPRTLELLRERR